MKKVLQYRVVGVLLHNTATTTAQYQCSVPIGQSSKYCGTYYLGRSTAYLTLTGNYPVNYKYMHSGRHPRMKLMYESPNPDHPMMPIYLPPMNRRPDPNIDPMTTARQRKHILVLENGYRLVVMTPPQFGHLWWNFLKFL